MKLSLSSFRRRWMPGRRGMALVITLILLAVTLMMAVAYLMLSRRMRNAGSLARDTTTARLAAESALAAAQGQMMANILATTNLAAYQYGLLVSTNFINRAGFQPSSSPPSTFTSLTNVSYTYANGTPLSTTADLVQNIANLWLLPRVPVFIKTPQGTNDFRFYLDLNRNGQFEGNGPQPVFGDNGNPVMNGNYRLTNIMTGDPEWVGVLQFPDRPHGVNNQFVARYAFAAVPIGNGLDLNYIHNQAAIQALNYSTDGYFRNQGVGSWELNLAAFLADLNTNQWLRLPVPASAYYAYNRAPVSGSATANAGVAFNDALSLLSWRYGGSYGNLASATNLFANKAVAFTNDIIDGYSDGSLQTTINTNADFPIQDNPTQPWAGADNTNHFFDLPSELFDPAKSSAGFVNHLTGANPVVNPNSSYSRYTFYRLLDQLGTDSALEQGKINLNYSNALVQYGLNNGAWVVTNITIIPGAETNQIPWRPQDFFLAAADRMLRIYTTNWFQTDPTNYLWTYYGYQTNWINNYISPTGYGLTNIPYFGLTNQIPAFGVTRIPVMMNWRGYTNFTYTPAVNRVLQLAANLYDASTNSFYPTVFRPVFERDASNNVHVVSYVNLYDDKNRTNMVSGLDDPQLSLPVDVWSLPGLATTNNTPIYTNSALVNVYGVPWIIGAKKYMPGLNQFTVLPNATFVRKLQVRRSTLNAGATLWTNQMVVMSVTNQMGISFWNPYTNDYPTNYSGPLNMSIVVHSRVDFGLTNSDWGAAYYVNSYTNDFTNRITRWPGSGLQFVSVSGSGVPNPASLYAWTWNNHFLTSGAYDFVNHGFMTNVYAQNVWNTNWYVLSPLPQFGLVVTNRLQAFIVDGNATDGFHVIDYVQLRDPAGIVNVNRALDDPNQGMPNYDPNGLWLTNYWGNGTTPSWGIVNQLVLSGLQPSQGSIKNSQGKTITNPGVTATSAWASVWRGLGFYIKGLTSVAAEQALFNAFLNPNVDVSTALGDTNQTITIRYPYNQWVMQAPFTPERQVIVPYLYQVNDPLVHYLASDLGSVNMIGQWNNDVVLFNGIGTKVDAEAAGLPTPTPPSFSTKIIGTRYQPWGVGASSALLTMSYNFTDPCNLIYKDPLIWHPNYWNFPTNKYPTVGWMGRVHRGTPWQTVYLKARNVLHDNVDIAYPQRGTNTWSVWTGDANLYDAANSAPIRDRLLFDAFTSALNGNATRGQLSVNQTHLAAWSALFSGMVALTNTIPQGSSATTPPRFSGLIIQPAGPSGTNSALGYLAVNINNTRALFTNTDGMVGAYEHEGDILSTMALTEHSPFLNWNNPGQQKYAIRDEAYEWLPQQMMGLVTCPAGPRYVVYCYGQALRPAPDSYASAPDKTFGLVTNYQVVAESAARAVIRLDRRATATGTNFVPVVETYNVLPPD